MNDRADPFSIIRHQAGVLTVTAVLTVATGLVLRHQEASLFQRPWLLALVPVINALGGNLGAVLGARLTSALHLGTLEPRLERGPLTENLAVSSIASVTIYGLLGVFVFVAGPYTGFFPALSLPRSLGLVLGTGALLTAIVIALSLASAFIAYRRGLDPDDIVIPVVTSTTDLAGVIILLALSAVML